VVVVEVGRGQGGQQLLDLHDVGGRSEVVCKLASCRILRYRRQRFQLDIELDPLSLIRVELTHD
jgi:hypothetical protein